MGVKRHLLEGVFTMLPNLAVSHARQRKGQSPDIFMVPWRAQQSSSDNALKTKCVSEPNSTQQLPARINMSLHETEVQGS